MATTPDVIEFASTDVAAVVARMEEFAGRGDGWINIGPGLTPEQFAALPARSTMAKWISGRGPAVPMATWTPASRGSRGGRAQLGIAHGTGPNALDRLREAGVALPGGWEKQQDHAKNGIVASLPDTATPRSVVDWTIRALVALSPRVMVGDDWIAEVFVPRR